MTFDEFCVKFINILKEYGDPEITKWNIDYGDCDFVDCMTNVDFTFNVDKYHTCEFRILYEDEFKLRHVLTLNFKADIVFMVFMVSILFALLKMGCIQTFIGCLLYWAMCYVKIPIMYLIETGGCEQPDVLKVLLNTDFVKPIFDTGYFRHDPEGTFKDVAVFKDGSTIFDIDINQLKIIISKYVKNVESKAIILDYIKQHQEEEEIGL